MRTGLIGVGKGVGRGNSILIRILVAVRVDRRRRGSTERCVVHLLWDSYVLLKGNREGWRIVAGVVEVEIGFMVNGVKMNWGIIVGVERRVAVRIGAVGGVKVDV